MICLQMITHHGISCFPPKKKATARDRQIVLKYIDNTNIRLFVPSSRLKGVNSVPDIMTMTSSTYEYLTDSLQCNCRCKKVQFIESKEVFAK